jgi:four helix bundle protein
MIRFHTFPIYQEIRIYIKDIYKLASSLPKQEQFELASQLRRAVTSILLNLAEGSMRLSNAELGRFILISVGSASEVVSVLDICLDLKYISSSTHQSFVLKSESIIKRLYGFRKAILHKS